MYKTTFQKIAILFNRSVTNLFSSGNVFGKLFLTVISRGLQTRQQSCGRAIRLVQQCVWGKI